MYETYDLIVIGGGSAGLVAAGGAGILGARVALIEKNKLGGDCLYTGCVPSKALIHVAKVAHVGRKASELGLQPHDPRPAIERVSGYIQRVIGRAAEAEHAFTKGVEVRMGHVQFHDAHQLQLNESRFSSARTIIATGSRPRIPAVPGLAEAGYWTNEDVFNLHELPPRLLVIGGGPIGCELAQAFARLDVAVTLIHGPERLLPREEPEVSQAVEEALCADGVELVLGGRMQAVRREGSERIVSVEQAGKTHERRGEGLLIALGRQPNIDDLGLGAAGVQFDQGGVQVDDYLRTSARNIYAIGDVIGGPQFSHVAAYHAGVAVRNLLLPFGRNRVNYRVLPWVTFTDPEAARVGLTEAEARQQGPIEVIRFPYAQIDRALADDAAEGFIKLIYSTTKSNQILGAHIVGANAGELLAEICLAMKARLPLRTIFSTTHAYPTYSTGVQQAAFDAALQSPSLEKLRRWLPLLVRWG